MSVDSKSHLGIPLTGTASQIEWAAQIRPQVEAEFDRVAAALEAVSLQQPGTGGSARARAAIAILEDKRSEVMAHVEAGYFIRHWRELDDQVRQLIRQDPRYQAIQSSHNQGIA